MRRSVSKRRTPRTERRTFLCAARANARRTKRTPGSAYDANARKPRGCASRTSGKRAEERLYGRWFETTPVRSSSRERKTKTRPLHCLERQRRHPRRLFLSPFSPILSPRLFFARFPRFSRAPPPPPRFFSALLFLSPPPQVFASPSPPLSSQAPPERELAPSPAPPAPFSS